MREGSEPSYLLPKFIGYDYNSTRNSLSYVRKVRFKRHLRILGKGCKGLDELLREVDDRWDSIGDTKEMELLERVSYDHKALVKAEFKTNVEW